MSTNNEHAARLRGIAHVERDVKAVAVSESLKITCDKNEEREDAMSLLRKLIDEARGEK